MDILIGTTNPGKVREIANILTPLGFNFITESLDIDENGKTIKDNANIKALAYSKRHPDMYIIAEDSGLVIPKLYNLPGAYSSRFHSIELDDNLNIIKVPREVFLTDKTEIDKKNNERVIALVKKYLKENERAAYFEVCFAIAKDGKVLYNVSKTASGYIITECRGTNGFGYDPIFVGTDTFGKTYAELDTVRKNMRSHRKKALKELGLWIAENIKFEEKL